MRYAIRSLLKAKGFTAVAVATIAVGIGANTAVFSVVDAVLLRPLPFKDSDRIFTLSGSNPKRGSGDAAFSYPSFAGLVERDRMFASLSAIAYDRFNLTGDDRPEQLPGARVSASFFDVLGVNVARGRSFVPGDDATGGENVVILSRRDWSRRFGSSPHAIGTRLRLNGAPYTVVGVLGIDLPPPYDEVDVWSTRVDEMSGYTRSQIAAGLGYLTAVGRLRPGVLVERAQGEVDAIARAYARANPTNTDANPDGSLRLVPIRDRTVGDTRSPLLIVAAAVGLVLLVSCANVANLLLVRATARAHEAAVRAALGASRRDLMRWLGAESLALAMTGGVLGTLFAYWGVALASAMLQGLPRGSEAAVNGRVLGFSLLVSVAAGFVFGLAPAIRVGRQSPVAALRGGGRGATALRGGAGAILVVGEVALSLTLLVGAGLLLESFTRLLHVPLGFNPNGLVAMRVSLPTSKYADPAAMRSFINRLIPALETIPGVAAAAASMSLPPYVTFMAPYAVGGEPMRPIGERPAGQWAAITPGYFATMQIPIVDGRALTAADDEAGPLVVVISQSLARRVWPNDSPIRKKMLVGRFPGFAEVVGVAGDVKNNGLAQPPAPEMYTPYAQRPWPAMRLVLRSTAGDPLGLTNAVRAALTSIDRDQPITEVETLESSLAGSVATVRVTAALLTAFAVIALVMAAAGLYGAIAFTVERRTQEVGIRVALGADAWSVLRLVAAEGVRFAALGMGIGLVAAVAASRALGSVLFDVSPVDPLTYAAVLVVYSAAALAAAIVPARRALRVDPLIALRAE
jgi:predicted permease